MKRQTKIILMFAPLSLLFLLLFFIVQDLKHPVRRTDACRIMAVGSSAGAYRRTGNANVLYSSSGSPLHDIAMFCIKQGEVVINDFDVIMVDVRAGDKAILHHTRYNYLPERWRVDVTADEEGRKQAP
jgi:zona occludens toxin (predicted ATPase)